MPERFWGEHDGVDFPHVVLAQQFSREHLIEIFSLASILKKMLGKGKMVDWLYGNIILTLFYEPSTRTRLSHETAAWRLGARVMSSENAAEFSSAIKGETMEDSIRIVSAMADLVVMRHKETGSAKKAALVNCSPIINGGDGRGQHPTQALLDVFTINEHFGKVDGLKVAMVGDLKRGRTVRSLAYMLSKFENVEIIFVAPEIAQMADDIKEHLDDNGVNWRTEYDLAKAASEADVIYMTRYQLERAETEKERHMLEEVSKQHVMNRKIAGLMPENSIIMHPLPRVAEIRWSVDQNQRAKYFEQAENGIYIRMALLTMILKPEKANELLNLH
ncbi:aspartate carbamoyltransferase [Candidatus Falkowbacteria bacterium]|nr:aspartate carbamoyltransferase [Candidatus Falkowbacteria bacterium]